MTVKPNRVLEFKEQEETRPPFENISWHLTKTVNPDWTPGEKVKQSFQKVEFDPYQEGRVAADNYKLLVSSIVPRPVGFISTISADGVRNLAPFSYTQVVNHDPPIFCIGVAGGGSSSKDTCQNIIDTNELTINMVSEWFIEAANYTSVNCPKEYDEWKISGLTPVESTKVKPPHVKESAFSIEANLVHSHEWRSETDQNKITGTLLIVKGVNFHAHQEVINEENNTLDLSKYKPVARLGGITYGTVSSGFELIRPEFQEESDMGHINGN